MGEYLLQVERTKGGQSPGAHLGSPQQAGEAFRVWGAGGRVSGVPFMPLADVGQARGPWELWQPSCWTTCMAAARDGGLAQPQGRGLLFGRQWGVAPPLQCFFTMCFLILTETVTFESWQLSS